ncbi:MAG: hypothetical protein J5I50_04805 [Chitinophagaceae bacterium]|nr:hypothetical protein [Chitinophagaceae bacterium]
MKKISLVLTLIVFASTVFAQGYEREEGKTKFAIGPTIGIATKNPFKNIPGNKGYGLGIGGMLGVEHFFTVNTSGIVQAGIISYAGRKSEVPGTKNTAYTAIPVRAGGQVYAGNVHFGALIGVGLNSRSGKGATTFAYAPQVGYNFSRNDFPLDFTVSLDGYAGHGGFSALMFRLSLAL